MNNVSTEIVNVKKTECKMIGILHCTFVKDICNRSWRKWMLILYQLEMNIPKEIKVIFYGNKKKVNDYLWGIRRYFMNTVGFQQRWGGVR